MNTEWRAVLIGVLLAPLVNFYWQFTCATLPRRRRLAPWKRALSKIDMEW